MTHAPFRILGKDRPGPWLVTCDHASNRVPESINGGDLGIGAEDMARHIAYDPGAAGVARALGELLEAPTILSDFSRLVIDPNRGEDDPTLIMKLYDGTVIPANRSVDARERARRLEAWHRPYHRAIAELAARREDTIYVAIHSYTRRIRGHAPRPWHVGILHGSDDRLARPLIRLLREGGDLCVGENEPYGGHLPGDSVDRHAISPGRPNVLIEIRNDLIESEEEQRAWAGRLAPLLVRAAQEAGVLPDGATGRRQARPEVAGLDDAARVEIEAAAFRRLRRHLMEERPDVQNIDLMNLAGFCRNCLSRWMQEAAAERGIAMDKATAREIFYGQPYEAWKAARQREASPEQKAAFEVAFAQNVGKDAL